MSTLLSPTLIVDGRGRGESIADLPFTPNMDNLEEWRDDWRTLFASAKIADPVDQRNCIKYLEFLGGVRTGSAVAASLA